MSVAPNSSDDIHLDAEGVRAALRTLDVLAGDLEAQTQRLRGVLDEAEAGDRRHGYLDGGLRMGYEAASLVGTARAELRDAVSNARATVRTLEEHDLGAAVVATTVILPTLASLPVAIAIPPIGADLGAAVERTDEAADAVGEVSADIGRLQEATTTISSLAEKTIEFQQVEDHHFARSMPRPFLSGTAYPPVTLPEQPQAQDPARSVIDWFKDRWSDAQRGAERQGARLLNVVAQLWRALQRLSAELQSFGRALWRAVQGIVDLFRDLLIEVWSNIWPLIEDYFGKFLGRILRLGQTLLSLAALILTFVPRAIAALLRGGLGELVRFLADTAKRFVRLPITLLVRTLELLGVMERLQGLLRLPAALGRQTAPLTTEQKADAQAILGGEALDWGNVRIVTGPSPANLAALSGRGLTIGNTIYLPPGMNKEDEKALIIHELVHVMQYEKTGGIYALEALAAQHIGAEYDYGDAEGLRRARAEGKHFRDFNREQQAQIVEDYYVLRQRPGQQSELRIYENFIEELKRGDL